MIFYITETTTGGYEIRFIKIVSETYRLGRRDGLGLGSTKEEVEEAFIRTTRTNNIIRFESYFSDYIYDLSFVVNNFRAFDFSFDEYDRVNEIRITWFP